MIFNIRGTNGSGKSHLVRELLASAPVEIVYQESERKNLLGSAAVRKSIGHYQPSRNLRVVGTYDGAKMQCGCDSIDKQQEVKDLIRLFASQGHVVFEGLLISGIIHKWIEFSQSVESGMIWCFLDTPFDVCMQRVKARNKGKPFNEKYSLDTWNDCRRHAKIAEAARERESCG